MKFKISSGLFIAFFSALLNFLILITYQMRMGGNFPYEDEWGYVDRLIHLDTMGFFQFLFHRYQIYFVPGLFAIWYFFYKFFHLSIMVIRITGAATSAIFSFLICLVIIKSKIYLNKWDVFLIGSIPFVFCSLNYWASYNQSIESIIQPFLAGCAFFSCWSGYKMMEDQGKSEAVLWSIAVVIFTFMALSMYAPALSILLAIAITRSLFLRKIDLMTILLGLGGLLVGLGYSYMGGGAYGHHILFIKGTTEKFLEEWILLFGNALITVGHKHSPIFHVLGIPITYGIRLAFDFLMGIALITTLIALMVRVIFLPYDDRIKYFIPFSLSLYTLGVSLEIALAYHSPHFGESPRYAILMGGAPLSAILWGIYLKQRGVGSVGKWTQGFVLMCVFSTLFFVEKKMPQLNNFNMIKMEINNLNYPITKDQQKIMKINDPLKDMVLPDIQFLKKNHLANFR